LPVDMRPLVGLLPMSLSGRASVARVLRIATRHFRLPTPTRQLD
jgi:hypothetical protein